MLMAASAVALESVLSCLRELMSLKPEELEQTC